MEPTRADLRYGRRVHYQEVIMGRGILLWLLGVPIPVIILLALIWH
jgi:cytochrome c-type biogenesis protein CcmH/NrfF